MFYYLYSILLYDLPKDVSSVMTLISQLVPGFFFVFVFLFSSSTDDACINVSPGGGMSSKPILKDLMEALYHKVADKWKVIGVFLEISNGTLSSIANKYQRDPQSCLVEMLGMWLEQVQPPPTWAAIIKAVEFIGEKQLGKELRDKYWPTVDQ